MLHSLFFFLMIRRPPRSTLFPTRRSSDLAVEDLVAVPVLRLARQVAAALEQEDPLARRRQPVRERAAARPRPDDDDRSEEHTSELQSRQYLVCRLLLEKKQHKHQKLITDT